MVHYSGQDLERIYRQSLETNPRFATSMKRLEESQLVKTFFFDENCVLRCEYRKKRSGAQIESAAQDGRNYTRTPAFTKNLRKIDRKTGFKSSKFSKNGLKSSSVSKPEMPVGTT